MPQSSIMFFFLIAGFFLFITMKGELPTYAAILTGNVNTAAAPTSGGIGTSTLTQGTTAASDLVTSGNGTTGAAGVEGGTWETPTAIDSAWS